MSWAQNYDPLGVWQLSTLAAALPVVVLLGLLASGVSALRSAAAGLATALGVAIFVFRMPISTAAAAAGMGACFGLFPIGWIVVGAVFLYRLTVASGGFETIKKSVAALSPDRRLQALLIAFSFGAFLEGAAGFGTPVAISAALMIGLGFPGRLAAGLALIANTAPVAFGGLGIPIVTLARMVAAEGDRPYVENLLSMMAGRQLPFFSLLVPAWMVCILSGWRGLIGCWPAVLACGGSFAAIQFLMSNFHGPMLVDVAGGVGSLVFLAAFLRFWKPKEVWRFPEEKAEAESHSIDNRRILVAWLPWALLSVVVFCWGLKDVNKALQSAGGRKIAVPWLHGVVERTPPVVASPKPEDAEYGFFPFAATGTAILIAAALSLPWLGLSPSRFVREFGRTIVELRVALATIAVMMALAFTTKYCGSDATMGLAFTRSGWFYPFFAAMLGWLGVALTGSDTSSNALFGSLQKITAEQLGLNSTLICAANSTGGVMGKMIDAQSIVVAAVATGSRNEEGSILRFVLPHSIALASLVGLLTLLQAYVLTWMVPPPLP